MVLMCNACGGHNLLHRLAQTERLRMTLSPTAPLAPSFVQYERWEPACTRKIPRRSCASNLRTRPGITELVVYPPLSLNLPEGPAEGLPGPIRNDPEGVAGYQPKHPPRHQDENRKSEEEDRALNDVPPHSESALRGGYPPLHPPGVSYHSHLPDPYSD